MALTSITQLVHDGSAPLKFLSMLTLFVFDHTKSRNKNEC